MIGTDEEVKSKLYTMQIEIDLMDTKLTQWIEKWKKQEDDINDLKQRLRGIPEKEQKV